MKNTESSIVDLSLRLAAKVRLYQLPIYVFIIILAFLSSSTEAEDVSLIGYGLISYVILGGMFAISYFLFVRYAAPLLKEARVGSSSLILYVAIMLDLFLLITGVTLAGYYDDLQIRIVTLLIFLLLSYLSFFLPLRFFTQQSSN